MNTLYSFKECVGPNRSHWYKSLIWTYLYDADVFLQFRVLIRLLELISVPYQSRDSFILIKMNTLYSFKDCVGPNRSYWHKSLFWTYLYDADVFLQSRVLIRLLELISVPYQSRDSFILIKMNTLYSFKQCVGPNRSYRYKSLIWTYLYDADVFLQTRVLIRLLELISVPYKSRDSFILIKMNTLYSFKECVRPNRS